MPIKKPNKTKPTEQQQKANKKKPHLRKLCDSYIIKGEGFLCAQLSQKYCLWGFICLESKIGQNLVIC